MPGQQNPEPAGTKTQFVPYLTVLVGGIGSIGNRRVRQILKGESLTWIPYFVNHRLGGSHVIDANRLARVTSASMFNRLQEKRPKSGTDVFAFARRKIGRQLSQERNEPVGNLQPAAELQRNPVWDSRQY